MLSEIGSNFWINPNEVLKNKPLGKPEQFGCKGNDFVWLSTGRSAISYSIKTIEERNPGLEKKALLPPFTCHTVIEPFLNAGYEVFHYPVEGNLVASSDIILETAIEREVSTVLFHRYFGFDTFDKQLDKMCEFLRKLGKYTIEDCTQCLYSGFEKSSADFFVGSIRKWHGTPDGGFSVCRDYLFREKPLLTDRKLEKAKNDASYAKYRFLFGHEGDKTTFLHLYRIAEDILIAQNRFYTISKTSQELQSNLNVNHLKEQRRNNFNILLTGLANQKVVKPLFNKLDKDVVPLYFPLLTNNRSDLQVFLAKHNIYAPIVWPKADCLGNICDQASYLYEHLLCIPIDQRYDIDDMNRILETINKFYKK